MGGGSSRIKRDVRAYPLPSLSSEEIKQVRLVSSLSRQQTSRGTKEKEVCPKATTTPNTHVRPCTIYSQATTRPNTENVLAANFGGEQTSRPTSGASASTLQIGTIEHFPKPPPGVILEDDDVISATTQRSASVHDHGSFPASRGMTPSSAEVVDDMRPGTHGSCPGTHGFSRSLAVPMEGEGEGEEGMHFSDEEDQDLRKLPRISSMSTIPQGSGRPPPLEADRPRVLIDQLFTKWSGFGQRQVELTIVSARHLPKMDLMGSINSYCEIEWSCPKTDTSSQGAKISGSPPGLQSKKAIDVDAKAATLKATGEKHTTTVKKDSFSPDWNETFTFSYDSTAAVSDLSVTVMDWDRLSKADLVGEVVIPADTLLSFLQQHQNVTHDGSYPVLNGGKIVTGHDKQPCVINLKMCFLMQEGTARAESVDIKEFIAMLEELKIIPARIGVKKAKQIFREANRRNDDPTPDGDESEMDRDEFGYAIKKIAKISKLSVESLLAGTEWMVGIPHGPLGDLFNKWRKSGQGEEGTDLSESVDITEFIAMLKATKVIPSKIGLNMAHEIFRNANMRDCDPTRDGDVNQLDWDEFEYAVTKICKLSKVTIESLLAQTVQAEEEDEDKKPFGPIGELFKKWSDSGSGQKGTLQAESVDVKEFIAMLKSIKIIPGKLGANQAQEIFREANRRSNDPTPDGNASEMDWDEFLYAVKKICKISGVPVEHLSEAKGATQEMHAKSERTMSTLRPNTEISQATTRIATINDKDVEQEVDEEVIDEWEQLRRRKAEKIRREAENMANIRMRIKMGKDKLRPPTPPPAGWEDVVRANRRFRLAIRVTLSSWTQRAVRDAFARLNQTISDRKYYRKKELEVRQVLNRYYRDALIPVFAEWKATASHDALLRRKSKKVMMWILNKDLIRAWGAWVANWAHKKDWRVCALKNCLHTRVKKASKEEIYIFAKSKRGVALFQDFASLTVFQLMEYVASSKVDIEAIHNYLTLEELLRLQVFKLDEKDKALKLVWKIDRLMREDTTRLDALLLWDGKMLVQVDMFMDEEEEYNDEKKKKAGNDDVQSEIKSLCMDLSPGGMTRQSQQMNASGERMTDTWAWAYILQISQKKEEKPVKLQGVKVKLVLQDFGIACVHVVNTIDQIEVWQSVLVHGKGPEENWYEFEFGEHDEEGNFHCPIFIDWENKYAIAVSISERGGKDDTDAACKIVYFLDHRPLRETNPQMTVRPGSFNGRWGFTPSSRNIEMQVVLKVPEEFGRDLDESQEEEPSPDSYQRGIEAVQDAHRKVEELLKNERNGKVDAVALEAARIELRRLTLSWCDEMFEDRLTYIASKKLMLEAPTHSTCAYHSKMREFWMLDSVNELSFLICDVDGSFKRGAQLTSNDNLKVFAFCFDEGGDMYIANNQNTFYRYIPADGDLCATYLRLWKANVYEPEVFNSSWKNASGVSCGNGMLFGIFKYGPIVQLSIAAGSIIRIIPLQFEVSNIEQVIYTMHRFIIVDAHAVKVCNIKGELVSVPLGPQGNTNDGCDSDSNPNATKMGCNTDGQGGKTISWRSYIENGMDRPRVLWDGSFLWIAETHLRKLDDIQLKVRNFMWYCYAPMTWAAHLPREPDAKRQYGRRKYVDLTPYWDVEGRTSKQKSS